MIIKVLIALIVLATVVLLPLGLALLLKQEGVIAFGSSCAGDDNGDATKACAACEIKELANCDYKEQTSQ